VLVIEAVHMHSLAHAPERAGAGGAAGVAAPALRRGMTRAGMQLRSSARRCRASRAGARRQDTATHREVETAEMTDWNSKIIEEFRANGGKVGGQFEGAPLLLLHTVGARTGQQRVNPMMYQSVPGGYAVFASKAGAPINPDWYHNVLAHPRVTAEIGTTTVELEARVAEGEEREQIWSAQKAAYPGFADYERNTTRQIPVIVLKPVS
jgi:deazaflavin-dependent oxidoreductase (nitroreductase family)